jgi:hypothetical protein
MWRLSLETIKAATAAFIVSKMIVLINAVFPTPQYDLLEEDELKIAFQSRF